MRKSRKKTRDVRIFIMRRKLLTIRIPKEKLRARPRAGVQASKPHKDKTKYSRKLKHAKKEG